MSAMKNLSQGLSDHYFESVNRRFYETHNEIDKPIGHGAFGIVWAVTDPRTNVRVALKKMPHVFQNLVTAKRVFRELRMLCSFRHENVLAARDVLLPCSVEAFDELYVLTPLMQSDLHKIIVSGQALTAEHAKIFTYQILRGLKYLHAADILHRDLKPGNLLVNGNCLLKICDFGLARAKEHNPNVTMTTEVVTQYYRCPELLMGVDHYGEEVDMWSVGCIILELLTRRIAFQANTLPEQLKLMVNTIGSPTINALSGLDSAKRYVTSMKRSENKILRILQTQSCLEPHDISAVELVDRLLCWNRHERISAKEALRSPFIDEGRVRFHSCMCTCCSSSLAGYRQYCRDTEPVPAQVFSDQFELRLPSLHVAKETMYQFIRSQPCGPQQPLCINPRSPSFRAFLQSTVAQPNEDPVSPTRWE
ncbi:Oidioi.mRNA.OKI2018_I69.PAR.g10188.t1.cds [Oikopleura dioica]|uniref:Mitogen-activated protein kinase n=1 Tax=Oikopleura dioica TaxID=34765 RepID=A0ABN7RPC3_OIKDI|nr:Oidioi.mRNA.OKI2018_I69.PAR.g10188.t1.cds [Oikopleura dioica]